MSPKFDIERPPDGVSFAVANTKPSVTFRFAHERVAILGRIVNFIRSNVKGIFPYSTSPDQKKLCLQGGVTFFSRLSPSSCSVPNLTLIAGHYEYEYEPHISVSTVSAT
jgi:hypothetical protein